jgi:hypothetical protein
VVKKESLPIVELLQRHDQQNIFQLEMTKQMGILRKRYPVEAYLLIASLPKERFVRKSHINLYRARQYLVKEMKEMVGPLRDFNGGMLSREQELLSKIQTYAPFVDETTTEALFYAIDPPIMRTQIDASLAGELFSKIDKLLDDPYSDDGPLFDESSEEGVIAVITTNSLALQKRIKEVALPLCETSHDLAITSIQRGGRICLGVAFRSPETKQRALFKESLKRVSSKEKG